MNETLDDQGPHPRPAPDATHATGPHQDLDRLRRSTSNRYIAGVAGGLGRHFDVDPTVIRVLLVVLTFFGGAGLLIYGACWLFVPEDTAEHAPIKVSSEPRKILLLAAAGIAFLLAVGDAFNGFDAGWPVVTIAVLIAIVLIIRDRRHERPTTVGAAPSSPAAPTSFATDPATMATGPAYASGTEATGIFDGGGQPPTWQTPAGRPPLVPPHPKRTGVVWFWPTLALITLGLGILGIYDNGNHVVDGAYPALALGITAVMLLVGSGFGRPGGLILIGFIASLALAGNVAVGGKFGFDAKEIHETPTSAANVHDEYTTTVGQIELDLSQLADPQELAGREIDVHLRTGEITVIVPRTLNVHIDAEMNFAGGIAVPGNDGGGVHHDVDTTLVGVPATSTAPLELGLDAKLGQINVEYR